MKRSHAQVHVIDPRPCNGSGSKLFAARATPVAARPAAPAAVTAERSEPIGIPVTPASSRV
jgi:hypothetical protein